MLFSSLDLSPLIQQALDACDYHEMTPIQEEAIIPARRGNDILACAQTGTGKTAAFSLPILQQMVDRPVEGKQPRALILTPTRELAEQLANAIQTYAQFLPLTVLAAYGGVKMGGQAAKLERGVDILIATPGRLLEHITQCSVNLSGVEFVVLDEADRMLDMGFVTDVQNILQYTAKKRQTLLFSATLSAAVDKLAHKLLNQHQTIRVAKSNATADTVEHVIYEVEERRKIDLFVKLLEENNWYQVLVFTSTKIQADNLLANLKADKVKAAICHGDKTQGARRRALADFKSAKIQVLIATEVAARGLDIEGLEQVVNYNLPYLAEDYVHRIGRVGRAGKKGHAISFVSRGEEQALDAIQRLIGHKIKRLSKPGFKVGSRESLLTKVREEPRSVQRNKMSETTIRRDRSDGAADGVNGRKVKKASSGQSQTSGLLKTSTKGQNKKNKNTKKSRKIKK